MSALEGVDRAMTTCLGLDHPPSDGALSPNGMTHGPSSELCDESSPPITTIIFDVDDTLYDVSSGFTAHRNTDGATSFMVAKLGFPSVESAQALRDEYFGRYHSTAKGLAMAEADGRLPPLPNYAGGGAPGKSDDRKKPRFDPQELSEWWAENLDYSILGGPDPSLIAMMRCLRDQTGLRLVAFSNGPRQYVLRVLRELGMEEFFPPDLVFAVDDVLPSCKPEAGAFERVFKAVGVKRPEECVMVEDSMKNVRAAKAMGMRTVLVTGRGRLGSHKERISSDGGEDVGKGKMEAAEATKPGDAPIIDDPAVDVAVEVCSEMTSAIPSLLSASPLFIKE